jgi:RNA polymerase sigma-70 factor (ECF subfamily)
VLFEKWRSLGGSVRGSTAEFEAALEKLHAAGQGAWPDLPLSADDFVTHVAAVAQDADSPAQLSVLSGEGLYVAAACVRGLAGAPAAFEAAQFPGLHRALAKLNEGQTVADEALQHLRVRLFSDARLLLTYSGRGAIGSWLKVVALRDAQRLRQKQVAATSADAERLEALPSPDADPELRFLKHQHRQDFKEAFAGALASLDARQKTILKMSFVEGLSIDEIGKVYDVHRATAARWIATAREQLVEQTRTRLAERLGLSKSELTSLMGLVRSNLSISLKLSR